MHKPLANPADLVLSVQMQLEMCKLKPGENVILLTDPTTERILPDIFYSVARSMGAFAHEIFVRSGTQDLALQSSPFDAPGLLDHVAKADLVVTFFFSHFSGWVQAVQASGGRIFNAVGDAAKMMSLTSTPELKAAVLAGQSRLRNAKVVQILSEAGTDLTMEIDKDQPIYGLYGMADEPGVQAIWGQGMVAFFPVEGSAHGKVAIRSGDVWILPYTRAVQGSVDLAVRDGYVAEITGDGADAAAFSRWLERWKISDDDKNPYALSHQGWGLNPSAGWDDILLYENQPEMLTTSMRSYPGHYLFSTGPSPKRQTKGHIDLPINACTILLDGETVIEKGRIVAPDMIVDPKRASH